MPLCLDRFLPWPMPALLAWAAGWAAALACRQAMRGAGSDTGLEWLVGSAAAAALAMANPGLRRRAIAALGFPLSALLLLALGDRLSGTMWLALVLPLVLIYPLRAWRDAPFFPTPAAALRGLETCVWPPPRRVLDAGCGLGHGLAALQRLWPQVQLHGVEWSAPMAWLAARRMPGAVVRRADMWIHCWAGFDLVYLFQRPETMPRAWAKAMAEMDEGAWLVSLEFAVPGVCAAAQLDAGGGRMLHVYRVACAARGSAVPAAPHSTASAPGR